MIDKITVLLKNKLGVYYNRVLLLILVLLFVSLIGDFSRIGGANSRIEEAQNRLEKLEAEKSELETKVESVNTTEFVETQIRDKLNLAKEDEVVLVLPDDEILRKIAPKRVEETDSLPDPNWRKWLKLFF